MGVRLKGRGDNRYNGMVHYRFLSILNEKRSDIWRKLDEKKIC